MLSSNSPDEDDECIRWAGGERRRDIAAKYSIYLLSLISAPCLREWEISSAYKRLGAVIPPNLRPTAIKIRGEGKASF